MVKQKSQGLWACSEDVQSEVTVGPKGQRQGCIGEGPGGEHLMLIMCRSFMEGWG